MKPARRLKLGLNLSATVLASSLLFSAPALGAAKWELSSTSSTIAAPGEEFPLVVNVRNVGDGPTESDEPIALAIDLPDGLSLAEGPEATSEQWQCSGSPGALTATCTASNPFPPTLDEIQVAGAAIHVIADPTASGVLTTRFEVSGGGIPSASIVDPTTITTEPLVFGADAFEVKFADSSGAPSLRAGSHPDELGVQLDLNNQTHPFYRYFWPVEDFRGLVLDLPAGFTMNSTLAEQCTVEELADASTRSGFNLPQPKPRCPIGSQIGSTVTKFAFGPGFEARSIWMGPISVFNMVPPPGVFARYGFNNIGVLGVFDVYVRNASDHGFSIKYWNVGRALSQHSFHVELWSDPGDGSHDPDRSCPGQKLPWVGGPECPAARMGQTLLRNPTTCTEPGVGLTTSGQLTSWGQSSNPVGITTPLASTTHELPGYPANPKDPETPWGDEVGTTDCGDVPVKGSLSLRPTSDRARSGTGLDIEVSVPNGGLTNPTGVSSSDIKAVKVTLPAGITINPSRAEGLTVCTPSQYAAESLESPFGSGCPAASKIGSVSVDTPLLDEDLEGSVFVAQPDDPATATPNAENPFDSLLALYLVIENRNRGVIVKLAGKVETDAAGRLTTTIGGIPQQPFDSFRMHLGSGFRSPLVTPRACGEYTAEAELVPWVDPSRRLSVAAGFEIERSQSGGFCPSNEGSSTPPSLRAGTIRAKAGSFSPFVATLSSQGGDEEISSLSLDLPAGLATKLAGLSRCSEADLAATERDSASLEAANPICPAASRVGSVTAGFGVGGILARSRGHVFLAGPYQGAPISLATVIPAMVGPFDLGTVVQRSALEIDPRTAAVELNARASTPIPSALGGIALHLNELRFRLDRRGFTLNPTSCAAREIGAVAEGAGADPTSALDDPSWDLSNPFATTGCRSLGFGPRLSLALTGTAKQGRHPTLVSTLRVRRGDANVRAAELRFPASVSLDGDSIDSVCSKRSFRRDRCPKDAKRGVATVATPLLAKPLRGPVYLRASKRSAPDLAISLDGPVEIDLIGRIESAKEGARVRFGSLPDVPIERLTLRIEGGERGILLTEGKACRSTDRAQALLEGQNGTAAISKPKLNCRPRAG